MSEVVDRLSTASHKVVVSTTLDDPLEDLRTSIDRGHARVKFTETRGGTELGFELEDDRSVLDEGDLEQGTGSVLLAGKINLDYVPVRVVAKIDLSTLEGEGHLEVLESSSEESAEARG